MGAPLALVAALAAVWQAAAPMPVPRSEVAATQFRGGIAVVGGYRSGCVNSANVDLFLPRTNRWRALPRLPLNLNHTTAVGYRGTLYVAGGYGDLPNQFPRGVYALSENRWWRIGTLPSARAAAGSAVIGGKWYIAGGVTPRGHATAMLVYDFASRRWSTAPGPSPRQHLGVAASHGKLYAAGGRIGGADRNLDTFEMYDPATRTWTQLPPIPEARGGTGLAAVGTQLVSVGGETPTETIASVYAFDVTGGAWRPLPSLPTPRHGLGVVGIGSRVYALGGGTEPGCSRSAASEFLDVTS
jgi:non-specific serine/threonine protein kinase